MGKVCAHAVVEFEDVEHRGVLGALGAPGRDVGCGDVGRGEAWVSGVEGEHGGQGEGFDTGVGR